MYKSYLSYQIATPASINPARKENPGKVQQLLIAGASASFSIDFISPLGLIPEGSS
jgi:hypothetical protein